MGEVEEERLVLVAFDERDGAFGVAGGELALIGGGDLGVDHPVIFYQRQVGVGVLVPRFVDVGGMERPHVVRVGQAEVFIEAVAGGEELRVMAEVPFADGGGGVALGAEQFAEGEFAIGDAVPGIRAEGAVDADAVRVASGEQGGAGGGADRLGDVEIGEAPTVPCHAIDVRGGDMVAAEAAEIGVALVVGEYDDDIGRGRGEGCAAKQGKEEGGKGAHAVAETGTGTGIFPHAQPSTCSAQP